MGPRSVQRVRAVRRASLQPVRSESGGVGMSATVTGPVKRSRWLDWTPKTYISADSAGRRAYKTIKTRFCRFCRCHFR